MIGTFAQCFPRRPEDGDLSGAVSPAPALGLCGCRSGSSLPGVCSSALWQRGPGAVGEAAWRCRRCRCLRRSPRAGRPRSPPVASQQPDGTTLASLGPQENGPGAGSPQVSKAQTGTSPVLLACGWVLQASPPPAARAVHSQWESGGLGLVKVILAAGSAYHAATRLQAAGEACSGGGWASRPHGLLNLELGAWAHLRGLLAGVSSCSKYWRVCQCGLGPELPSGFVRVHCPTHLAPAPLVKGPLGAGPGLRCGCRSRPLASPSPFPCQLLLLKPSVVWPWPTAWLGEGLNFSREQARVQFGLTSPGLRLRPAGPALRHNGALVQAAAPAGPRPPREPVHQDVRRHQGASTQAQEAVAVPGFSWGLCPVWRPGKGTWRECPCLRAASSACCGWAGRLLLLLLCLGLSSCPSPGGLPTPLSV